MQPGGSIPGSTFLNSSVVAQTATCLSHRMPGTEAHRSALFPGSGQQWYWPMAGWVNPVDPSLTYVVLLKIQKHDYNGDGFDPFDFFVAGDKIATISTADQHLISISDVTGYADGDFSTRRPGFGEGITSRRHARLPQRIPQRRQHGRRRGARRQLRRPRPKATPTAGWEFWTGTTWSALIADAKPMTFTDGSDPSAAIHPTQWGTGWLAVSEQTFLDRDVRAWTAPSPQGPWTAVLDSGGLPANIGQIPPLPPGGFSYGARLVQLPGSGWTLAWNTNDDFWDLIANVRLYGPHFATPVNLPPI